MATRELVHTLHVYGFGLNIFVNFNNPEPSLFEDNDNVELNYIYLGEGLSEDGDRDASYWSP